MNKELTKLVEGGMINSPLYSEKFVIPMPRIFKQTYKKVKKGNRYVYKIEDCLVYRLKKEFNKMSLNFGLSDIMINGFKINE